MLLGKSKLNYFPVSYIAYCQKQMSKLNNNGVMVISLNSNNRKKEVGLIVLSSKSFRTHDEFLDD